MPSADAPRDRREGASVVSSAPSPQTAAVTQEKVGRIQSRGFCANVPDWAILLLCSTLLLTQTILGFKDKSATWDEGAHLLAGYLHLTSGDYGCNTEHPPFVKMLAALPLLSMDVKLSPEGGPTSKLSFWRLANRFLYEDNKADRLLFLGRLGVLPLLLLLGVAIFFWSKQLFGREAASLALLLYSFEPNILAYGGLVHTDVGATCFFFLTVFAFYRLVRKLSFTRLLFAGIALGLALVTKFSTLPLLLVLVLLGVGVSAVSHSIELRLGGVSRALVAKRLSKLLILVVSLIGMLGVAYGVIWATYRFRYEGAILAGGSQETPWNPLLPAWISVPVLGMKRGRLLPEAYLDGLASVLLSSHRPAFLMGEISTDGWWYYFVATFLLKTPLPLLLLLALAALTLFRRWRSERLPLLFLTIPVLIYFGIATVTRLNIGHRHILPIYPFLLVLTSSLMPWAMKRRTMAQAGIAVLVAWYLFSSVAIFPHYLAYSNELSGGPGNGYRYLVDSNLDWGQDLKGLKRYMEEQGIDRVWLSYFGTASPEYYGISYNYLPSYLIFDPKNVYPEVLRHEKLPLLPGTVAISATNLQGVYLPALGLKTDYFDRYREQRPVAKIGYSIFIYRFE